MLKNEDNEDDFKMFVMRVVKDLSLLESLLDFLDLANHEGIDICQKILFLGEYQKLLFDSLILGISHLLFDKVKDSLPRMRIEMNKIEKILELDIQNKTANRNFTVEQKVSLLNELKKIQISNEYKDAIKTIKTLRNKRIAHFDKNIDLNAGDGVYGKLKIVVKNIYRCYEIRQLVLFNIGETAIHFAGAGYNHRNIIEALLLQKEIRDIKDTYNSNLDLEKRYYSSDMEFFYKQIKPRVIE